MAILRDLILPVTFANQANSGDAPHTAPSTGAISAKRLHLHPDTNVAQGMQIVVRNCLVHISSNAAGVLAGGDIECIHQMRVGLRRLRSALKIFDPLKPCPARMQAELAWLTAKLGEARDWDVLETSTIPSLSTRELDIPALTVLQQRVHREVLRKHHGASVALASARSTRLWLMLERWLDDSSGALMPSSEQHLTVLQDFALQHIRHFHKKLLERCVAMDAADVDSRHQVRIGAKRLRYAIDFFASYYPRKSADLFMATLADLQDTLGASNDTAVADRLLHWLAQRHPDLTEICAYIRGYMAATDDCRRLELGKQIRRFSALKKLRLRVA
ncbi:MAG TPA: CHAD domain-containing protein [Burkholderiaceae bacterium]|nr:CHAD domain-containing protein [Burkholderiaceae bacterium]